MGKMIVLFAFCLITLFSLPNNQYSQENEAVITTLVASSYLTEPYDYFAYHPVKLFDDNSQTFWFENRKGPGIEESIYVEFQNPVTIDEIRVMPGCFLQEYYIRNYRVKTLDISCDGKTVTGQFRDEMTEQVVSLGGQQTVKSITLTIKEVFETSEYKDTAISEIGFYCKGVKLKTDVSKFTKIIAAQPKMWQDMELSPKQVGEQWGFTDPTGSFPIAAVYHKVFPFKNGKAAVDNRTVASFEYDVAGLFRWEESIDKRMIQITVPIFIHLVYGNVFVHPGEYDFTVEPIILNGKKIFCQSCPILFLSKLTGITIPNPQGYQIIVNAGEHYENSMNYIFYPDGTCKLLSKKVNFQKKPQLTVNTYKGKWNYYKDLIYIVWEHKSVKTYNSYSLGSGLNENGGNMSSIDSDIYRHETLDWSIFYKTAQGSEIVPGVVSGGSDSGIKYYLWDSLIERSEGGK